MAGKTDYLATADVNWVTGVTDFPAVTSRYLGLFTTAPTSDSGVTGAVECSLTGYARVQVAGALAVSGSSGAPSTGTATFTLAATAPAWLLALGTNGSGVTAYDLTLAARVPGAGSLGTVSSITTTTVTLTGNSAHTGALSDSILFSAWPLATNSSGSEPVTTPASAVNGAAISLASLSGGPQTVVAFGIFDALTSGNCLEWDYLGNFKWSPFEMTLASPGVATVNDQTFVNGQFVVMTNKFGGVMPTTAGSFAGILTVAGVSGQTFNVGVNSTAAGDGQVRQVIQQAIGPSATVFSWAAGTLTLTSA
jgi:hypothetical protein